MREPLMPLKQPKNSRLGFVTINIGTSITKVISNKDVSASEEVETSEDPTNIYYGDTESNEYEWDSCTTNNYEFDHVFHEFDIPFPSFTNLMDINILVDPFHEPDPPKTIDGRAWI